MEKGLKRIAALLLAVFALFLITSCSELNEGQKPESNSGNTGNTANVSESIPSLDEQGYEELMVGDHVYLGTMEQDGNEKNGKEPISWTVIDVDDTYCTLITDRIIGHKAFDTSADSSINWANSTIRSWMSIDLFNDIFSEAEQAIIVPVKTDESGKTFNTYEAEDKIFLLSKEQAEHYLLIKEARVIPSEQKGYTTEKDAYHREKWWVRTSSGPGKKSNWAHGYAAGELYISQNVDEELGVRPVVVVRKADVEVRPLQLPERDEYRYISSRAVEKTAPIKCMNKLLSRTTEYFSEHYDKAFRKKVDPLRAKEYYVYYLVNTTTGEILRYDDRYDSFTPSSYTISVEKNVNRFSNVEEYETIDMGTAARGFFD